MGIHTAVSGKAHLVQKYTRRSGKNTEVSGKAHAIWYTHIKNMALLYAIYDVPDGTNVEHHIWCALHVVLLQCNVYN